MKRTFWLLPFLLGACVSVRSSSPAPVSAPQTAAVPTPPRTGMPPRQEPRASLLDSGPPPQALHWTRTAAEHRAILVQAYRGASQSLRELTASLPRGGWAVILDADETVLDNSAYFQRQAAIGYLDFGYYSWIDFVKEAIAPALPGAVDFTRLVKELGGSVVIVTNRAQDLCADTRRNLERASIPADAVLCRPPGVDDKNPRFQAVEKGEVEGLPAMKVVMFVGDNIQDFPGMFQAAAVAAPASAYGEFGRSWWILPNPIYGSWQRNPLPAGM